MTRREVCLERSKVASDAEATARHLKTANRRRDLYWSGNMIHEYVCTSACCVTCHCARHEVTVCRESGLLGRVRSHIDVRDTETQDVHYMYYE